MMEGRTKAACRPCLPAGFSPTPPFEIGESASTAERRTLSLHEKLSLAGHKGGTATKNNYGLSFYSEIGSLGGRPPLQSKSQLRELERANIKKESLSEATTLNALRVLLKHKIKTGEGCL